MIFGHETYSEISDLDETLHGENYGKHLEFETYRTQFNHDLTSVLIKIGIRQKIQKYNKHYIKLLYYYIIYSPIMVITIGPPLYNISICTILDRAPHDVRPRQAMSQDFEGQSHLARSTFTAV